MMLLKKIDGLVRHLTTSHHVDADYSFRVIYMWQCDYRAVCKCPCSCTGPICSDERVAWGQDCQVRREQIPRPFFRGKGNATEATAFAVDLKTQKR